MVSALLCPAASSHISRRDELQSVRHVMTFASRGRWVVGSFIAISIAPSHTLQCDRKLTLSVLFSNWPFIRVVVGECRMQAGGMEGNENALQMHCNAAVCVRVLDACAH